MPLTFLLGGARSGKSALAVDLARRRSEPVTFVATAEARDREMSERIARHRAERPRAWTTLEAPVRLEEALSDVAADACLVVDCLSLWVANVLEQSGPEEVRRCALRAAAGAAARPGVTIAVSNEVGMGIVPATALGRAYRDALGSVNAVWAAGAETALLVVAGRVLPLASAEAVALDG